MAKFLRGDLVLTTTQEIRKGSKTVLDKDRKGSFSLLEVDLGTTIDEFSIDGTLAGNSDTALPTEKAIKTYVDNFSASSEQDSYQDLLSTSKYQNLTFDDFSDTSLVDTGSTTMNYDQANTRYTFTSGEILQSENLFDSNSGLAEVTECMVEMIYTDSSASINVLEVTADGTNWEITTLNTVHEFTNTGIDLRVRYTGGGSGSVSSWGIFYNPSSYDLTDPVYEGLAWTIISSNVNAVTGKGYLINASGGNITLTLPPVPSEGDRIGACDYREQATTNTITIARNGNKIEGSSTDLTLDIDGAGFTLVYTDSIKGWKIVSEISTGTVTASETLTDNYLVRGSGGKVVQSTTVKVTDDGEMTNPSQPCFHLRSTNTLTNFTGDGTDYAFTNAGDWSEIFDQGSNVSNGTFTAPVTGKYLFTFAIMLANLSIGNSTLISLITSNRTYAWYEDSYYMAYGAGLYQKVSHTVIADMDASDTAYVSLRVVGGAKTVDTLTTYSNFMGALLC